MSGQRNHRIFISYAHRDGAELAARLQHDLTRNGFDAWRDVRGIQGGSVWTLTIEHEIDNRDVVLALLTPSSYRSHICRAEQLRALRKGKRLIPVLATKDADIPLHIEPFHYRNFSDRGSYQTSLRQLLGDILGDTTATLRKAFRETRVNYVTAPPLVANYLERPEAVRLLRDSLFAEDHRRYIALTALAGMGGVGKTVMAQALIRDEVVQQAFPDGIVWITIGREKQRDFAEQMREIVKALGDDLSRDDNPLACQNQYKTTIANRAALIVIDDVWSRTDIDPLLAESPRSRFLFTTRDASIANFVGARKHQVDLLDLAESRELLGLWANLSVEQLPPEADEIIRECGQLPLALAQIGAILRNQTPALWEDILGLLRKVDLSAIREQLPPGQDNFFRAVEVSFLALTPRMQEKYKALAMLLEDMPAALQILQLLWKTSEAETRLASKYFVDRSLAQREPDGENIRLHDLQLDYVRFQYPDKEALRLIHSAIRLSSHVIVDDPMQFAGQIAGRLMVHAKQASVQCFVRDIVTGAPRPWLRSQWSSLDQAGGNLSRTLQGHSASVNGVAITPDGRRAVSASTDKTLMVWNLHSGQRLLTLQGHSGGVNGVAITPDGRHAISASADKTLMVWDLDRGQALLTLQGHSDWVNGVAVTPDGRRAVSASDDNTLKVWDLDSGQSLLTLQNHPNPEYALFSVKSVAVTLDGRCAVSGSYDQPLKVWDLDSGQLLFILEGHSDWVNGVAMTPDGRRAVSASADNTLKVWNLDSGQPLLTLRGHSQGVKGVRGLAVTPDGRCAVSASADNTLKVWDLDSGQLLFTLQGHSAEVNGVAVTPDGRCAVSASDDNTLKMWSLEGSQPISILQGHSGGIHGGVHAVAITPDGKRAISGSWDRTLKVWNLDSGQPTLPPVSLAYYRYFGRVSSVAVTPDGRLTVSGGSTLTVWDQDTGQELMTLEGHREAVNGVAVTPDGRRAVSASTDNTLMVWDLDSGQLLRILQGHSSWVAAVAVTPDGRCAVSASNDETLKVWDLDSGQSLLTLKGHSGGIYGVAITPDGRCAVSASADKTLKVWDLDSGQLLRILQGHSSWVAAVAVTPDGRRAASVSDDHTLKVWNLESGQALATFVLEGGGLCCAFVSNKTTLAGDGGGRIYLLSLEE